MSMKNAITEMIEHLASMREGLPPHMRSLYDHLHDAERALSLAAQSPHLAIHQAPKSKKRPFTVYYKSPSEQSYTLLAESEMDARSKFYEQFDESEKITRIV